MPIEVTTYQIGNFTGTGRKAWKRTLDANGDKHQVSSARRYCSVALQGSTSEQDVIEYQSTNCLSHIAYRLYLIRVNWEMDRYLLIHLL